METNKTKEYHKEYRLKNREKLKEYHKEYHLKNREKLIARAKEHYKQKTKLKNIEKNVK